MFAGKFQNHKFAALTTAVIPSAEYWPVIAMGAAGGGSSSSAEATDGPVVATAPRAPRSPAAVASRHQPGARGGELARLAEHQPSRTYCLGDGGNYENLGVIAALQRGAASLTVFDAANVPISDARDWAECSEVEFEAYYNPWGFDDNHGGKNVCDSCLMSLFGYGVESTGGLLSASYFHKNQVFPRGRLLPLLARLQKLQRAGEPMVVKETLEVVANPWWGIEGRDDDGDGGGDGDGGSGEGRTVTVVFFYLGECGRFEAALPEDTRQAIAQGRRRGRNPKLKTETETEVSGPLQRFPQFATMNQNDGDLVGLTNAQTNLLAAQVEWTVRECSSTFLGLL
jgi:hypothetical protein